MKLCLTITACLSCLFLYAGENLLPNGSFDKGQPYPENWERADGLTSFWLTEKGRERILKLDTRPERTQVLEWRKVFKLNPDAKPPVAIIPKKPLQSVASNEGTCIDSSFIKIKPGQNYKLTVDYKGAFQPFVWIKGFMYHPRRKFYVDCYQTRLEPPKAKPGEKNKWRTVSIGFNPTAKMPRTEKIKVRIYAYWPRGVYYFDNVKIEEITPAEMKQLVELRSKVD